MYCGEWGLVGGQRQGTRPSTIHSGPPDAHTLASQNTLLGINSLEHGSILQDVGDNDKSDESTADEYLFQC